MNRLPAIQLPAEINYVGLFLSMACNLDCAYCINDPRQRGERREMMAPGRLEMPPELWVAALARLPASDDLPITLQGGEPTLYWRGRGLGQILAGLPHKFDLLTNLALPVERLAICLDGQQEKLRRSAPYPSIRVSYHPDEMDRAWNGRGIETLVERCLGLAEIGFTVGPHKAESDVGIYMVDHPANRERLEAAQRACAGKVPFETKEFLGRHDGVLYGSYRYPHSTDLVESGVWPRTLSCECRTTELLIDPLGFVWPCHLYLYETWMRTPPVGPFARLRANGFEIAGEDLGSLPHRPVGHILDPDFSCDALRRFHPCGHYGRCIGCDTKIKNDRFQSLYDYDRPHNSVEIRAIRMPEPVLARLPEEQRRAMVASGVALVCDDGGEGSR